MTVVVVLVIAVTIIVIVALFLKNRKGHYSSGIHKMYVLAVFVRALRWFFSCTEVK